MFTSQLARALQEMELTPAASYAVAVSGGADSVALLLGLLESGFGNLEILHLNHGLRGEDSAEDAAWVAALACRLGLPLWTRAVDVADMSQQQKMSLETAGRQARRAFFAEICSARRLSGVFLGHHAEDQAETLLHRMMRGAGSGGLAGMRPVAPLEKGAQPEIPLLRPMLGIRKAALLAWLQEQGQDWREDATNAQPIAARNRLRNELLPLASEIFQRDPVPALLRLAASQAADEAWWETQFPPGWQSDRLPIALLRSLPPPLLTRLLLRWLRDHHRTPEPDQRQLREAAALLTQESPASVNLAQGRRLRRTQGEVWIDG